MKLEYRDFERILNIGVEMSTQKNRNKLLASILDNGMLITHCDASTLYLLEDNRLVFKIMKTLSMGISRGVDGEPIEDIPPVPMTEANVCAYTAIHREIVNIPDVYHSERFDFSGPKKYDALTGYHTGSQLVIPIENNEGELLGVLQLINALDENGNVIPFDEQYHIIIRSLGSMAAIELTNLSYVEELKAQLHSFVEAFATAVDERTPYNGSHTRKVAKYAGILADYMNRKHEAGECEEAFDEERKEKLCLAALLHDIGKMIIPLRIMNRATRLDEDMERVENRFELLAAYYDADRLRGRLSETEYQKKTTELREELEFIYKINAAGFLKDEDYEHVKSLAGKSYVKADGSVLPYLTEREADCLSIRKGTLTESDRRQMENHAFMTGKILDKVRFQQNYSMVPRWAADHHEFLDGSGYPNHLKAEKIDLETRILTVVDIYDAMTSADRPYKEPMPKEKAFSILRSMAGEGKIELRLVNWLEEALQEQTEE
ncbi:MAG: HD domain-containing protein [Lachnospiraceae bacterium]|nr:HD domain-containing protein [Lachnospiraceae bacterium]